MVWTDLLTQGVLATETGDLALKFLLVLIFIRVLLYAATARKEVEPTVRPGSALLFVMIILIFGVYVGVPLSMVVIIIHRSRERGGMRFLDRFAEFMPHSFQDISIYTLSILIVLVINMVEQSQVIFRYLSPYVNSVLQGYPFVSWLVVGVVFWFAGSKHHGRFGADFAKIFISLMLVGLFFGPDKFTIFLVFLSFRPIIDSFSRKGDAEPDFEGYGKPYHELTPAKMQKTFGTKLGGVLSQILHELRVYRNPKKEAAVEESKEATEEAAAKEEEKEEEEKSRWASIKSRVSGYLRQKEKPKTKAKVSSIADYISFKEQLPHSGLYKVAVTAIILILILVGGAMFGFESAKTWAGFKEAVREMPLKWRLMTIELEDWNPIEWAIVLFKRNFILPITSPFYVADVEKNLKKDLGIELKEKPLGSRHFYRGEQAGVSAVLKGDILDRNKCYDNPNSSECTVSTYCNVEGYAAGTVTPSQVPITDILGGGERIDCDFIPLEPGTKRIRIGAEFEFETKSYMTLYLVSKEQRLAANREGIDILKEKGLPQPVAKRTPGPVYIAIGFEDEQPIGVPIKPGEGSRGIPFGITIGKEKLRGGKIIEVKDLEVILPNTFEIAKCSPADFRFVKIGDRKGDREKLANLEEFGSIAYHLEKPISGLNIDEFLTVTCRLFPIVPHGQILRTDPPTQEGMSVNVKTRNRIEEDIVINVRDISKRDVATRVKRTSAYDVCSKAVQDCEYSEEQFCHIDPCKQNCFWYLDEWIFGDSYYCASCDKLESCRASLNKHQCQLDPCDLGCEWHEESKTCIQLDLNESLGWPVKGRDVESCEGKRLVLSGLDLDVKAIESGVLSVSGDEIIIKHPDGYESYYKGLTNYYRELGNVYKGELIGLTVKDFRFWITKNNEEQDVFELYKNIKKGDNCEQEKVV